jgi:hypothetical protein
MPSPPLDSGRDGHERRNDQPNPLNARRALDALQPLNALWPLRAGGATRASAALQRQFRLGAEIDGLNRAVLDFFDVTTSVAAVLLAAATTAETTAAMSAVFMVQPHFSPCPVPYRAWQREMRNR